MIFESNEYSLAQLDVSKRNNLDLLRFIAATLVIFSHSYLVTNSFQREPLNRLVGFLNFGSLAVYIFFLISGYLITKSLFSQQSLGSFVLARALRIFPGLIICSLVCSFLLGPLLGFLPVFGYFSDLAVYRYAFGNSTLLDMQVSLPGLFYNNPYPRTVNSPLWTLKAEILMYIFVFGVGFIKFWRGGVSLDSIAKRRGLVALAAGVIIYLIGLQIKYYYIFHQAYQWIIFFFMGMAAFAWRKYLLISIKLLLLLLLTIGCAHIFQFPGIKILTSLVIAYSVFLVAYHPSLQIGRFSKYGDFSYGLYIYGFPIQQSVATMDPLLSPLANFAISYSLCLPMAIASWHFIEKPALRLKMAHSTKQLSIA